MPNQNLVDYIKKLLSQGHSRDEIRDALLKSGWGENQISEAFASIEKGDSGIAKFPRSFIKVFVQNKKLIFSILGVILVGGLAFASWQIWGTPKEATELSEQQEEELPSETLEEEFSVQDFNVVAFPAADGQFPMPTYEKMERMMIDDFFGSTGQAEFYLYYIVGGKHKNAIRDFYIKVLEAQEWNIEDDYETDIGGFSGEIKAIILSFSKAANELYEIDITISEDNTENGVMEGWPTEITFVQIIENWPTGFDYAKDLTPNSPFCQYFDRDFKKVLGSVVGKVKLSGLHEMPEYPDQPLLRWFYYASQKQLSSVDDIIKIKEAFISNGYRAEWTEGKPIAFSKELFGKTYSFEMTVEEEGFVIYFPED